MGSVTSRIRNHLTRPIREYNLQDRAHKAVLKNKYVPSPKHPSTLDLIRNSLDELPSEVKMSLSDSDKPLMERLRKVYVTSEDVTPVKPMEKHNPDKPLPTSRTSAEPSEYGIFEPKVVPYGKATLKQVLKFITQHQEEPEQHTAETIAHTYKLDLELTEHVLRYFGTFRLIVPSEVTPKQELLLKDLQASSAFLPNSTNLQRTISGIAMKNKPSASDSEGKLPLHRGRRDAPPTQVTEITLLDPGLDFRLLMKRKKLLEEAKSDSVRVDINNGESIIRIQKDKKEERESGDFENVPVHSAIKKHAVFLDGAKRKVMQTKVDTEIT